MYMVMDGRNLFRMPRCRCVLLSAATIFQRVSTFVWRN